MGDGSPDHLDIAGVLSPLARVHLARGDAATALRLLERAIAIETRHVGPEHVWVLENRVDRARALAARGREGEAVVDLERSLAGLPADDVEYRPRAAFQLARLLPPEARARGLSPQGPGSPRARGDRRLAGRPRAVTGAHG